MKDDPSKVNLSLAAALRAEAQALDLQAAAKRAQADALEQTGAGDDPLLDVDQVLAEFGVGRDSLKAAAERGELSLSRGARGKLLIERSAVRAWIKSRPVQPRKVTPPVSDLECWEAEAERALAGVKVGAR